MPTPDTSEDTTSEDNTAQARRRLPVPIVLVGLMGAGKSSIGRLLANRLDLDFVDADSEIEAAAGSTIEEIFERHGEAEFRAGERRVIARLLKGPPRIIATGGGAFMDPVTRGRIGERAVSVWLKADLDTLAARTARRGGRPLLKGQDSREVLARLIELRYPVYAHADITVETSNEPPEAVLGRVITALEAYFGIAPLASPSKRAPHKHRNGRRNGSNGRNRARRRRAPAPAAEER